MRMVIDRVKTAENANINEDKVLSAERWSAKRDSDS